MGCCDKTFLPKLLPLCGSVFFSSYSSLVLLSLASTYRVHSTRPWGQLSMAGRLTAGDSIYADI